MAALTRRLPELGEQIPQRLQLGGEFAGKIGIAEFGGPGDLEQRLRKGSADCRVPGIAAGDEALRAVNVAGDADRHLVTDGCADLTDALIPSGR